MRNLLEHIFHLPRNIILWCITLYQKIFSPDHGLLQHLFPYGFCPQEPTCSEYGKQLIQQRGCIVGGFFLIKRLLSCHPWKKPNQERILHALLKEKE